MEEPCVDEEVSIWGFLLLLTGVETPLSAFFLLLVGLLLSGTTGWEKGLQYPVMLVGFSLDRHLSNSS